MILDVFRTEQERMIAASKVRENPVPYADRLAFWQRVKARRAERQEQREREDLDISRWLAEKAPTPVERWAQEAIDGASSWGEIRAQSITGQQLRAASIVANINPHFRHVHVSNHDGPMGFDRRFHMAIDPGNPTGVAIFEGEMDALRIYKEHEDRFGPSPISSARRTRRQVEVLETIDVDEVFWDLASMLDAHRNGATALDRPLGPTQGLVGETPVWEELTRVKWDPTKERGPRELDYVRKMAKQS